MKLLYYDVKAVFISVFMLVAATFNGWSRERAKPGMSVGYGSLDVSDTDK